MMIKRILTAIFAVLLAVLLIGCSAQTETVSDTQQPNITADDVTPQNTPLPQSSNTETPEVTQTVKPKPVIEALGCVRTLGEDGSITFELYDEVSHKADELDKNGDPYGHDWTEISPLGQRVKLTDAQSASYKYADLFAENAGSDGKLKLSKISYTKFEEVCRKEYYGSRLYFRIRYRGEKLLEASLLLDYYLAG